MTIRSLKPQLEIVTFTTLFPNDQDPIHGVFVENRLQHLVSHQPIVSRVVAPVPWFPLTSERFGRYARLARVRATELRSNLPIYHPRYPLLPKLGMALAPACLFVSGLRALKKLQRERDFDLIDAHYLYPDGVAAAWMGRAMNKPVVITARGTDVNLIPDFRLPRRMILAAAKSAAGIIAVSQALKDGLTALGVEENKVRVMRNGVDLELFRPEQRAATRSELHLAGPVLLSVGHLITRKGHDLIIRAMPQLADFTLLIVGDGPQRAQLEGLARGLNVADRVRFLGRIPHQDLHRIYAAADALILASSREGWPNVLLEAMACGTPVVASNIWGNPEVVSKADAGVLMKERSVEGVADGVKRLFQKRPEREATRRYAEGFGWEETSAAQYRLFTKILSDRA